MKPQKRAIAPDVTAQPRSLRQESPADGSDEGLSIDPESLGQSFLRHATAQGPVEADGLPELQATGAAASDAAQIGSHFSSDASIWENTADLVTEHGGDVDDVTNEAVPPLLAEAERDPEEAEQPHVVEIDLTESVIEEASLLDEESSVLGETVPREPHTEDTGLRRRRQDEEAD